MEEQKLVYIASPYAGTPEEMEWNIEFAKAGCRYAIVKGYVPIAPHLLYPQILDDSDPEQRALGLGLGLALLARCDEQWICGETLSEGMRLELDAAEDIGMPIKTISSAEIARHDKGVTAFKPIQIHEPAL